MPNSLGIDALLLSLRRDRHTIRSLSHRIAGAFLRPRFKTQQSIDERDIESLMNDGRLTFAIDILPGFQRDIWPDDNIGCRSMSTRPR
jgi:hypothetical protein